MGDVFGQYSGKEKTCPHTYIFIAPKVRSKSYQNIGVGTCKSGGGGVGLGKQTLTVMMILEGITLDLVLDGWLWDNSEYFSIGEGRDNVKERRSVTSYWDGVGCIKSKDGKRMAFFMFCVPNELQRKDMPGNNHYQGTDKIAKSGLDLVQSLFQFDGWVEGDAIADEFALNEAYANKIIEMLELKMSSTKVRFPFSRMSTRFWIEIKPLLDQGIISRPNYQMEMLAEDKK